MYSKFKIFKIRTDRSHGNSRVLARTKDNVTVVDGLVLRQEDQLQIYHSTCQIHSLL